jgi:hypothetical protein
MPAYYLLVPAGDPLRAPFLHDRAGAPPRITATPRRLPVSEIIDEDPVTALLGRAHQLVTVAPLGPVTTTAAGFAACAGGWAETARSRDLGPVTGPQHAAIVSLITEAARLFTSPGEDSLRAAGAYASCVGGMYATPQAQHAWEGAMLAAVAALDAAGADGFWWSTVGGCGYGTEVIALAARDLIGTTAAWRQEAYDLLTRPWTETSGQPAHPADIIPLQRP